MPRLRHVLSIALMLSPTLPLLAQGHPKKEDEAHDVLIPDPAKMQPLAAQIPIQFVAKAANAKEWDELKSFWNEATGPAGKVVKIKVPLGLSSGPTVPPENPMTVAKWVLGKKLYFDPILSSNKSVSCASCHDPKKGYTDQSTTSLGINNLLGGANAPTVINSGYHRLQFWDGRADSLEAQAQGPVGNSKEMFAGKGEPWVEAVQRLRADEGYVKAFEQVFGHAPTRDAAAKAIAAYERTVLVGNSLFDRAEVAMRKRVAEEESGKFELKAEDFLEVLKAAFAAKDAPAISALGLDPAKDADKAADVAKRLANGRNVYFGKARCSNCHVGENFTDLAFHNLGVGVKDGKLPATELGRFGSQPTGHKDPAVIGAFKTPGLRALNSTGPYMHDGEEKTLEAVVDFYDRGGNANEFLDPKMRDTDAEIAFVKAKAEGKEYTGPKPALFTRSGLPIIPFQLKLTPEEKADLVLFMKALQSDPVDATVADKDWFPK
jgi:cytochrome c peroxidase